MGQHWYHLRLLRQTLLLPCRQRSELKEQIYAVLGTYVAQLAGVYGLGRVWQLVGVYVACLHVGVYGVLRTASKVDSVRVLWRQPG